MLFVNEDVRAAALPYSPNMKDTRDCCTQMQRVRCYSSSFNVMVGLLGVSTTSLCLVLEAFWRDGDVTLVLHFLHSSIMVFFGTCNVSEMSFISL